MINYRLDELERSVRKRNPLLADRLNSPLSNSDVKMMLRRSKVVGAMDPVLALYTWKNGTIFDQALMVSKTGIFPGTVYQFIDIKKAIEHMKAYRECVCSCFPKLANLGRRYFPVFWNGATNWIGLDLDSGEGRVVLIRYFTKDALFKDGRYEAGIHEKEPPRQAYDSFQEFIADAIHANENDEPLTCMRSLKTRFAI
jgi:hypothetical protein